MVERWYVGETQQSREMTADHNLRKQGWSTWLPRYGEWQNNPYGKGGRNSEPVTYKLLFPGYICVRMDLDDGTRWRSVNGTLGMKHLLPQGLERPVALSDAWVERISAMLTARGKPTFSDVLQAAYDYAPESAVSILHGRGRGAVGQFVEHHRNGMELFLVLAIPGMGRVKVAARDCAPKQKI